MKQAAVIICTHNRAKLLRRCLTALAECVKPNNLAWEVVVVLSNCSDESMSVAIEFTDKLPLKIVEETAPGHSRARNRGIAATDASFLIWTDDDVSVSKNWLVSYLEAMRSQPHADYFCGPINPTFEGTMPDWIAKESRFYGRPHCYLDYGSRPRFLKPKEFPVGANMAFRRVMVRSQDAFRTDLGRVGSGLLGGDEQFFFIEGIKKGHRGWYLPEAMVDHYNLADRLTEDWLRRYFFALGKAQAISGGKLKNAITDFLMPTGTYVKLLKLAARIADYQARLKEQTALPRAKRLAMRAEQFRGLAEGIANLQSQVRK